jgi:hypothetical protein
MNLIWRKMTDYYADKWTSKYGEDPAGGPAETWAEELYGKNYKQVRAAISACLTRKDAAFPPTLPEFIRLCGKGEPTGPRSSGKCDACGWDFEEKHFRESAKTPGKQVSDTRDRVHIPIYRNGELFAVVTRCGECYMRELEARGKAQMQQPGSTLVEASFTRTDRSPDLPESQRPSTLADIAEAVREDARRLGFFDPPPEPEPPEDHGVDPDEIPA